MNIFYMVIELSSQKKSQKQEVVSYHYDKE